MGKLRRAQIIERMKRGGKLVAKGTDRQPGISGGYTNPNYVGFGYDDCHRGDVKQMIAKAELLRNDSHAFPYVGYDLAASLMIKED